MTQSFEDRVFIVTGGSSGIGEVITDALAERGGHVLINGRTEDRLTTIADRHPTVEYVVADMSHDNGPKQTIQHARDL